MSERHLCPGLEGWLEGLGCMLEFHVQVLG